jgi:hypothetical protein
MSAIIHVPKLTILRVELKVTSWNTLRTFIWLIFRPRLFDDVASNAQSALVAMSELGRKGRKSYWRLHRPGLETRYVIASTCVTLIHGACSKCCTLLLTVVSLSPPYFSFHYRHQEPWKHAILHWRHKFFRQERNRLPRVALTKSTAVLLTIREVRVFVNAWNRSALLEIRHNCPSY